MKPLFRRSSIQSEIVLAIAGGTSAADILKRLKITRKKLDVNLWVIKKKLKIKVRDSSEAFLAIQEKCRNIVLSETGLRWFRGSVPTPDDEAETKPKTEKKSMTPHPPFTDSDLVKDLDDIDLAQGMLMNKIQKCGQLNGMSAIVKRIVSQAIGEVKALIQAAHKKE